MFTELGFVLKIGGYLFAPLEDGRVVSASHDVADLGQGVMGFFVDDIHSYLTGLRDL